MGAYILRRLLLMIPTIFGIMALSFLVVQFAPGGPVEQAIAKLTNQATTSVTGTATADNTQPSAGGSTYRGSRGLDQKYLDTLNKQFGFDKPPLERFGAMLWNYARLDFGRRYFRDISVIDLIKEKMPVSITLGLWMTLISYGISIPLGIAKAVRDGSRFDVWSSSVIVIGYAVPGFLVAILLIVLFAGGSFWYWFPLRRTACSTISGTSRCRSSPCRSAPSPRPPSSPRIRSSTKSASNMWSRRAPRG